MALTKVTKVGITNDAVDSDKLKDGSITTAKIGASAIESSEINDGTITVDDLVSTLDVSSKTVTLPNTSVTAGMLSNTLDLSSKTVTLSGSTVAALKQPIQDNIGLLGFKMAVNDGLTVFNLIDGVVDEFHDESGTDEGEGSNDLYCASNDLYQNLNSSPFCSSAGFGLDAITEADTSVAPSSGSTAGRYTVPNGMTAATIIAFGAGGSAGSAPGNPTIGPGGGGGYTEGVLAVTAGQVLDIYLGQGGYYPSGHPQGQSVETWFGGGAGHPSCGGNGGGLTAVITGEMVLTNGAGSAPAPQAPLVAIVAGSGGAGGGGYGSGGGAGGGTTGCAGESQTEQVNTSGQAGGAGDQEQGGSGKNGGAPGLLLVGGDGGNGGGAGYYGGGGGCKCTNSHHGGGGGGSSYYGHPAITSGSTEEGGGGEGGGTAIPTYVASTNEGTPSGSHQQGEPGYVLITGAFTSIAQPGGGSSTIFSNAFAAGSVPTKSRIVVFQENVETPTLNTDIIASVSRNGGSNFTNVTLADSGYVTGSSGQRILTGQATISGQPSGQSMRWKLALANETVKIHGVALQWS